MRTDDDNVIDPVCGMHVKRHQLQVDYLQMEFAFCSEQCRERFLANPRLYVGTPGKKSIGQTGQEFIKRRRMKLQEALPEGGEEKLHAALCAMMGIKQVIFKGTEWEITYDLLQATAEQIERTILHTGAELGGTWSDKLRRAFVHYLEETALQNLEHTSGGHCHHH